MTNSIGWCDQTWNPVVGCHPVSSGCHRCYAARMATRLAGNPRTPWYRGIAEGGHWTGKTAGAPTPFKPPRRPSRIFVGSMTDLFHNTSPIVLARIIRTAREHPQHTFMVLTKRPEFMRYWLDDCDIPPNLWLGVSVEDQATADERIPILLGIKASVRFVSAEPLLGPVDLEQELHEGSTERMIGALQWVIAGPETGPGARTGAGPWIHDLEYQCTAAGVPFYDKSQFGAHAWPTVKS